MLRSSFAAAALGVVAALTFACPAEAVASVKTKTVHYKISGKSGDALLEAMDRRGPKNGFMTHAIAQTAYTVSWSIDWREKDGRCRILKASAVLSVTYHYPQVTNAMPAGLQRRWNRFMIGVHKHEETHGRIARQMVKAAERSLSGLSYRSKGGCSKIEDEAQRRITAIYADFEARQVEFDRIEHSDGGNVERLVTMLSKGG